jgi:hypothetical protein
VIYRVLAKKVWPIDERSTIGIRLVDIDGRRHWHLSITVGNRGSQWCVRDRHVAMKSVRAFFEAGGAALIPYAELSLDLSAAEATDDLEEAAREMERERQRDLQELRLALQNAPYRGEERWN